MQNYFEEKSSSMNGTKIWWFVFLEEVFKFWEVKKSQRWLEKKKMEKTKAQKEANVELLIFE